MVRNKIDFTSKSYVRKWFAKREKDTLPVERILSPEELRRLHNNILFTRTHFPHVLQNNIIAGMPNKEDEKV